jgi:hypothetical protein
MAPCLAPVLDEGFEGAAFYAVGEVLDGGADDFVAAPDCEGLVLALVIGLQSQRSWYGRKEAGG